MVLPRDFRRMQAVDLFRSVLHCAYHEPEALDEELRVLDGESVAVASLRDYAEHLDAVLHERMDLFDQLRLQLRQYAQTLRD